MAPVDAIAARNRVVSVVAIAVGSLGRIWTQLNKGDEEGGKRKEDEVMGK